MKEKTGPHSCAIGITLLSPPLLETNLRKIVSMILHQNTFTVSAKVTFMIATLHVFGKIR